MGYLMSLCVVFRLVAAVASVIIKAVQILSDLDVPQVRIEDSVPSATASGIWEFLFRLIWAHDA